MRCGAFHRVEGTLCLVRHGQAALSGSKTKAPGFAGGYLLNETEQARRGAMEAGQYAAAVAAVKEKGVLSGKRVERRESGSPGEFADLENMTAKQLAEFIRKQARESLH